MNNRKGFTLIELLVVIAIIAILAAILFPVFAQARAKARQTVCLSNEKEIGLGILMYAQDFDERFPFARTWGTTGVSMPELLSAYINKVNGYTSSQSTDNIWKCPSDTVRRINPFVASATTPQTFDPIFNNNDVNRAAWPVASELKAGSGDYVSLGRSLAAFSAPANTFILTESANATSILGNNFQGVSSPGDPVVANNNGGSQNCSSETDVYQTCTSVVEPFHNKGWDYLYGDGHAKFRRPEQTVGTGVGGNGKDASGNACTLSNPCGEWTLDPND